MGQPAARITDMHTCPMVTGLVPHVGGPIVLGSFTVFTGDLPQARVTDMLICVGPPDVIVEGSSGVFVNDLPAARLGDMTAHGGVIVVGLPTVLIGETGGADDDSSDSDKDQSDSDTDWKSLVLDFAEQLIDPLVDKAKDALKEMGLAALHGILSGESASTIASQIQTLASDAFKSAMKDPLAGIATPTLASVANAGGAGALAGLAGVAFKYVRKYIFHPQDFPIKEFAHDAAKEAIEGAVDAAIVGVATAYGGPVGFAAGCALNVVANKGVDWAVDAAFKKF